MNDKTGEFIGGNILYSSNINKFLDSVPNSTFDLVILRPDINKCPVKETVYSSWIFDLSKRIMKSIRSTGSLVTIMKEGVKNGKRKTHSLEYLSRMSDNNYWTETFIWHKTNPHPTGNKKRLKDGFEYCFHFTRSSDYKFFPDKCLVEAKDEWIMGEESSILTRPSNLVSFPSKKKDLPVGLVEHFINLMTDKNDLVFVPFLTSGNEIISCLNTSREYLGVCSDKKEADFVEDRVLDWKSKNICVNQTIFS